MKNKIVITIARQYGSGGREIGKIVSKTLGIPYLDKEIISAAVAESGIHADLLRNNDERVGNPLGQAFAAGGAFSYFGNEPTINDKIFIAESDVIKKYAQAGSCVIIGRCASYILREEVEHLSVFVNADLEDRMRRAVEDYGEPSKKIRELLIKRDKQRAHYHHYYTDERWMDLENAAKLIIEAAQYRCAQKQS